MSNRFFLSLAPLKFIVVLLFILTSTIGFSQDIGILTSSSPVSGCELSNSELVTVVVFNFGGSYSGSFDVSYSINGGVPVTENVTLSPFPATSTFSYTFTTPADLSNANTYNFQFYTNVAGDVNNSNDTLSNVIVVSDTLSYGGIMDMSQSLCIEGNSGTLNLTNAIGDVQYWESSVNSGGAWNNIPNITNIENYNNLTQETWYRAVVINGLCPQDTSSIAVLSIDQSSVGGTISGSTTICVPPNNGILTLAGETGSITDWEYSSNGGGAWNSLSTTTNTYNYINQPSTYLYRTIVQNGSCPQTYSDTAEVIVMNGAVGGTLSPSTQSVCVGSNSGNITLNGEAGTISSWESSTNSGGSWSPITNTTSSLSFTNLTQETWYRTIVTDCNVDTSSIAIVTIENNPIGGSLSSDETVCINSNSGTITLSGETGTIIDWESSTTGGSSWNTLSNTLSSYSYNNISTSTLYRAIIGNGSCSNVYSDTVTITVDDIANAGTITAPLNVCATGNSGSLVVNGINGTITDWEFSINGGSSWTSIGNTTNTNAYTNLTQTTLYQVTVSNGVCPNEVSQHLITVDNPSNPGTLIASDSVCLNASGFNYLNGYQGNIIDWEESTNNGANWNSLSFTGDTLSYTNITNDLMYRVIVKNGSCLSVTSNEIELNIYPFNIGTSNDTIIEEGTSATISAYGGVFYSWTPVAGLTTPNTASTIATPTTTTDYTVSIIDSHGCIFQDNVLVTVNPIITEPIIIADLVIADLITANGDGFNDTWNLIGIENYPDTKVMVFNTSGNLVFESDNYNNDWNGNYNGTQLPDGTYYYIVELSNDASVKKGFLTIVSKL